MELVMYGKTKASWDFEMKSEDPEGGNEMGMDEWIRKINLGGFLR